MSPETEHSPSLLLQILSLAATAIASVGGALVVVGRALARGEVVESRVAATERLLEQRRSENAELLHAIHALGERLARLEERLAARG